MSESEHNCYGQAKAGRTARTYIQQLCEDTGCSHEDLPEAMNDRESGDRGSGISVLAARHDDDDDERNSSIGFRTRLQRLRCPALLPLHHEDTLPTLIEYEFAYYNVPLRNISFSFEGREKI